MGALLELAELPRSTYYDIINRLNAPVDSDKWIKDKIQLIYESNKGRYGYRRITIALNGDAEVRAKYQCVNHKRVKRLMNCLGLKAKIRPKKYKSYRGKEGKIANNVLERDFESNQPEKKMVTDVTEFRVCNEKIYLSPLIDLCTKEVVSYSISKSPSVSFVMEMLKKGLLKKKYANLIIHSDQGFQYQNVRFRKFLEQKGITQSMSRKGNCFDNACAENFFSHLKAEFFYMQKFNSLKEFIDGLHEYIRYYNNDRINLKRKMAPMKYRNHLLNAS